MLAKEELVSHFDNVRKRTLNYLAVVPEELFDWRPNDEKFSIGDIVRHLGSTELMFYHLIKEGEWKYNGHGKEKGETMQEAVRYLAECHETVMAGLRQLSDEQLSRKVKNLVGYEASAWRYLMVMAEHEIHHRGQLSAYLQMNKIDPPQIFGLKIEQVAKN